MSLSESAGLIVMVSSVSFLIPPMAYPARCVLLVTSLLVLVNLFNAALTSTPSNPGGLTALSIWILGCIAAAFTALVFYVFILVRMNIMDGEESSAVEPKQIKNKTFDRLFLALHIGLFILFTIIYCVAIKVYS